MSEKPKHFYQFGPFLLEPTERRLSRDGRAITGLEPKSFDLLVALVEARGAICTNEELRKKVWPDSNVEDSNIPVQMSHVRKALDDGKNNEHKYIETVRGLGGAYRLLPAVTERWGDERAGRRLRSIWVVAISAALLAACALILAQRFARRGKPSEGQRFYALALDYERKGDDDQALAALDRAVALDPTLAEAYLEAACIHHDLDEEDNAADYLGKAKSFVKMRDEAFGLRVEALDLEISGYQDQALQDYQLLVDRFPQDAAANYRLADLALVMERLDDAERALTACLKAEPSNPYCNLDAVVLSLLRNDFDGVLKQYQNLIDHGLHYPWLHAPVGSALLGKGDLVAAESEFRALEEVKTRFHGTAHFRAAKERLADLNLYTGRFASARAQLRESMESAQSADERADDLVFLARIEALVGNIEAARSAAVEATQVSSSPLVYISAARVLASIGDADTVNSVLGGHTPKGAQLGDVGPANINFIKGAFALKRGKLREALSLLDSSYEEDEDPYTAYTLAQAHQKAHLCNDALAWYGRVLAAKGDVLWNDIPALLPLAQYQSANCYRELGKIKEAHANYSEFLALWSHADPEMVETADAKRALGIPPK